MSDDDVSWIARERLQPGLPSNQWITAVIILAGATFLVLAVMGLSPVDRTDSEELFRTGDGPQQALDAGIGPNTARWLRAAGASIAVLATAFAARRLLHHEAASVMAAGLLLLDPGFLVHGRLATPVAAAAASGLLALALFLSPRRNLHWAGGAFLGVACFIDPSYLPWSGLMGILVLARGHIYAAPQHALHAGIQSLVMPLVGAGLGVIAGDSLGPDCFTPSRWQALSMSGPVALGDNIFWHANPALWLAGIVAVIWLGTAAAAVVLKDFRLQRLPGRIQVRLTRPLRREQGRALWILALAVLAPVPLWMPILGIAIAAAVIEIGRDSSRFGILVGLGVLVIAIVYAIRLWPLLAGFPGSEAVLDTIPWASATACA